MSFDVEGTLHKKMDTTQVTDSFRKREFVLEIEDGNYPQHIKFQLIQSNCEKIDPYNEGDKIKVTFSLKGRPYNRDGETIYFTNLDAWRIEKAGSDSTVPSAADNAPSGFPAASDEPASSVSDDDDLPF